MRFSTRLLMLIAASVAFALVAMITFNGARAADVPQPTARGTVTAPKPAHDWSGFYIGGHGGYAWNKASGSISPFGAGPFGSNIDADGMNYGIHAGAQKQFGALVLGVEADISKSDADGTAGITNAPGFTAAYGLDYYASARVKAGLSMHRLLPFVTAGGACGRGSLTLASGSGSIQSDDFTACGYVVGGGADYAVTDRLSLSLTYLYSDLGDADASFKPAGLGGVGLSVPVAIESHAVRVGASLRF